MLNSRTCALLALAAAFGFANAEETILRVKDPKDWRKLDRLEFSRYSQTATGKRLLAKVASFKTFAVAASVNTLANRPEEYNSIAQRSAYYNLLSHVIEFDDGTPPPIRSVKFFHATTLVTTRVMLGFPESVDHSLWGQLLNASPMCAKTSEETRAFILEVNRELFRLNMGVLHNLLFVWKELRRPGTGEKPMPSAYDFDLAMVELEQGRVSTSIAALRPSATVRKELNTLFGACLYQQSWMKSAVPTGASSGWAERARGGSFDFYNETHRIQIGKALVTMLHGKSEDEFRATVGLKPLLKP